MTIAVAMRAMEMLQTLETEARCAKTGVGFQHIDPVVGNAYCMFFKPWTCISLAIFRVYSSISAVAAGKWKWAG
jgi:hypothetical protein